MKYNIKLIMLTIFLATTKSQDLWTSCKDLYTLVNYHLCEEGQHVNVGEFEGVLRKYKQNFHSLLQNPVSHFLRCYFK